ncbi:MAG TPA: HD domain-containing protein [Gemmataceae bacterium]|nr:HD domain-containing protein [Gemmataceae bacterium]
MPEPASYRMVLDAIAFAARAHHGQMRKDGRTPYVSHVFRVTAIVRNVFGFDDPRMLATALLHDTIEDTTTDFDDLEKNFGREIAEWVALLTKEKRLPETHREQAYMEGLKGAPWQVQVCKLADVYDNLLDSVNLPAEKRPHSRERAKSYVASLEASALPQTQRPLALVKDLLSECSH